MQRRTERRTGTLAATALALLLTAGARTALGQASGSAPGGRSETRAEKSDPDLDTLAATTGLKGTMHGARHELGTYVFTWWNPKGFFENQNLSLVPANPEVGRQLGELERHQAVTVWGKLVRVTPGQTHVRVERLLAGDKWSPGVTPETHLPRRPEELARKLAGTKRLDALVHAVAEDGSALAIEYRDEVIPVQVPPTDALRKQVAGLYRGDRIRLRCRVAPHPSRPLHLIFVEDGKSPLEVRDALHLQHDQVRTVEGHLVLFPKSPVLNRSIWGVEERGPEGLHRYYTIFNFQDAQDQAQIDARLQAAWDSSAKGVLDARNKYVHTRVRVRVTGKVNDPSPNQANPTLVTTAAQVEVTEPRALRQAAR